MIHSFVRRHVSAMPDWQADEWGVPINQTDMAATLVGTLIAPSTGGIGMGIVLSRKEYDAIAHLTRYVGWLIGVRDEFLPHDFRDGMRVLYHTVGALTAPDESTRLLARPMIDDPLQWHYRTMPKLRRRIARSQHLSMASGLLGPRTMRALGLPAFVLPWYPMLRMPVNLARSIAAFVQPGGMDRAASRGDREQKAFLRNMIGEHEASHEAPALRCARQQPRAALPSSTPGSGRAEHQRDVEPAEPEAVGERVAVVTGPRLVGHHVEVDVGIETLEVQRGRHHLVAQCLNGDHGTDRPRRAPGVPERGLRRVHHGPVAFQSEVQRVRFGEVAGFGACGVGGDHVDVVG
jgi:hypothetical protein